MKSKVALLRGQNQPLEIAEVELTPPGEEEVQVRIHASGVCHSDLNVVNGTSDSPFPIVLGHEGAGVVEAVGTRVKKIKPGDHVVLSWNPACGDCEECIRGLYHLCTNAWAGIAAGGLLDGTSRMSLEGDKVHHYSMVSSFAERTIVPEKSCVKIPQDVPLDVASLVGCAVTTGVGAIWNSAQVRPGDKVAVLGCGGVGLSAILGAVGVGASQVIAVDTSPKKLEDAIRLGATDIVHTSGTEEETASHIRDISKGGVDYAIDAVGLPQVTLTACLSTRRRGTTVAIGIPREEAILQIPALTIPRMERRIIGSLYGSALPARDFPLILDLFMRGKLPLERLISHRFSLKNAQDSIELIANGGAMRAILDISPEAEDKSLSHLVNAK